MGSIKLDMDWHAAGLLVAQLTLLTDRVQQACKAGKGINLHRKEVSLALAALKAAAEEATIDTINHYLTEQDDDR